MSLSIIVCRYCELHRENQNDLCFEYRAYCEKCWIFNIKMRSPYGLEFDWKQRRLIEWKKSDETGEDIYILVMMLLN